MSDRKTAHATFVIERTFSSLPPQVFAAWADVKAKARWFVGPDNGVLSLALARSKIIDIRRIDNEQFLHRPVSQTFHGRDVFAPAAAYLAAGVPLERLGPAVSDPERLRRPGCRLEGGELVGEVLAADRFGNLITSIPAARLAEIPGPGGVALEVAGRRLRGPVGAYAEGGDGEPAVIVGSTGRLEIFVRAGSARDNLGAGRGAIVRVRRAE